jgi:flagellar protein FlaI
MTIGSRLPDSLRGVLGRERDGDGACGCDASFDGSCLVVDAGACEHDGDLVESADCRSTVISALTERDVDAVRAETAGLVRAYEDDAAALLVAAGRFVEQVRHHDERLADRALTDPLGACREATGRAGPVAAIAAETGLAMLSARAEGYDEALAHHAGPTVSRWRVSAEPPPRGTLRAVRDLDSGGTVRTYETDTGVDRYHLLPMEQGLSTTELEALATAYEHLASGAVTGGDRAPARAVRAITGEGGQQVDAEMVTRTLRKHARGFGLLADFFADPRVSDVFVTAPAPRNRLRVRVDGETLSTNVRLTDEGVDALASRFRRESGRAFSRADPTLDATAEIAGRQVRVAGVTEPPSTGTAFAFRAQDPNVWTLPGLIGNGTLSALAGAVLSLAVERGSALLIAGPRGAGKTTLLGALLWELPPAVRTVVIEDTPELPVDTLQAEGRDVQQLLASTDEDGFSPAAALRTALRLGDGALAVGEVRGEEAAVLYEAMRVGANSEAVLGTIHGDGARAVYERVVDDLDVPPASFGVTDLIVTLELTADGTRRLSTVEEVRDVSPPTFQPLFEQTGEELAATGCIERGNSHLLDALATPAESYADLRGQLSRRAELLSALSAGTTGVETVQKAHQERSS